MALRQRLAAKEDTLDQVAGVTGFGWTASVLGYLSTAIGYSNALVTNPQSLLYLGAVLFVTTLGLDRLKHRLSSREE
jgi:hypothetical protein